MFKMATSMISSYSISDPFYSYFFYLGRPLGNFYL